MLDAHNVVILEGLNHFLQESTTGDPAEYGATEQTIAPAALELISDWMLHSAVNGETQRRLTTSALVG